MREIRRAGDRGLLVETSAPHALRAAILAADLPGVTDVVPGEATVLVVVSGSAREAAPGSPGAGRPAPASPRSSDLPVRGAAPGSPSAERPIPASPRPAGPLLDLLERRLRSLEAGAESRYGREVEIPVVYDGADLAEVAELTGLSAAEVAARHSAAEYTVAYLGFSPGFGYLTGLDPVLRVPRRAVPRTSVPAGSVAVAGPYTAVYPSPSPGGWRLLGRTGLALWDVRRDPPSLLAPGDRVRFVPAR
ncbi:5-oxoprolinase subunit PxpB [Actinocorallia populi]|uniref:5-oxoprolinase subunit PxpB n=1 Tax=Actinocorallia populi TaxID=2079200 RepID=UPI000D08773E|nr:5-oxoprolinase subunit PxpB [Actinocorallia populi]